MDTSQHIERGRVAPLNPDPRWPAGYFEVLEALGVAERQRRFYAHCVRQFFQRHQGRRPRDFGRVEIEAFLRALTDDPAVADWQVAQARDAVEVYYEEFRGIALVAAISCAPATGFVPSRG